MPETSLFIRAVADVVLARVIVFDAARDLPAVAVLDLTAFFVAPWDVPIAFVALRAARVFDALRTCVDALRAVTVGVRLLAVRAVLDWVARAPAFVVLDCVVRFVVSRFVVADSRRAVLPARDADEFRGFDCERAELTAARFVTLVLSGVCMSSASITDTTPGRDATSRDDAQKAGVMVNTKNMPNIRPRR